MEKLIEKIYAINCKEHECEECKNGLEWCPKSYCDDYLEAKRNLEESENMIRKYIK